MTKIADDVIEKIQKINLVHYLERTEGYIFKENGCYWKCKQHDSLIVQFKDGNWHFEWNSQNSYGNIINFARTYQTTNNFRDAVKFIQNHEDLSIICIDQKRIGNEYSRLNKDNMNIEYSKSMKRTYGYLIKSRGLDKNIIRKIYTDGLLKEDINGNVVLHWICTNKIVGAEKIGTNTSRKFKSIVENSDENYGFNIPIGNINSITKIFVFEASLDLLSYLSLHSEKITNSILLSLSGVAKTRKIGTFLNIYRNVSTIICCIDNDVAGRKGLKAIKDKYRDYTIIDGRNELLDNNVKDFNDLLKNVKC